VIQAHADAFLARLRADSQLVTLDGATDKSSAPPYVLVYLTFWTPDGEIAPDKVPLTFDTDVLEVRGYCHSVGANAMASRAVAQRVRAALLNQRLTIPGRDCFPIRWKDGNPAQRDESTGVLVIDQVDVYGFTSVPG
jgi:hypothetical protein